MDNKRFFKIINSEKRAYLFGFILGDGCINSPRECTITLNRKDKEHLFQIGKWFGKKPFNVVKTLNDKTYLQSRLSLSSVDLVKDLEKLGIIKRKTYELDAIKVWNSIPQTLKQHFIRGYFDADGCITFNKKNQPYFSITSFNKEILEIISSYINKILSLNTKVSKGDGAWRLRAGGSKSVLAIGNLLYHQHTICLDRKIRLFSKIKFQSSTGFMGISKSNNRWKVKVITAKENLYLGTFSSKEDAVNAYEACALKINGKTNGVYKDGKFQFWKYQKVNYPGGEVGSI